MKSVDLEEAYPKKTTEDVFDDYGSSLMFSRTQPYQRAANAAPGSRRRIEEYLEKKRLRELLQEDVVE